MQLHRFCLFVNLIAFTQTKLARRYVDNTTDLQVRTSVSTEARSSEGVDACFCIISFSRERLRRVLRKKASA